ncbi:hypothetical protein N825_19315 [Skermanella stibiiresistens SB22]|uniref:Phasin domain-containing protein n=2 Tax=Skermanella TaxID=204447 RepID=W9H7W8_9PROT|nr:hypothetical protein N825_19315 [Skermanella stibiiresistens SB22]
MVATKNPTRRTGGQPAQSANKTVNPMKKPAARARVKSVETAKTEDQGMTTRPVPVAAEAQAAEPKAAEAPAPVETAPKPAAKVLEAAPPEVIEAVADESESLAAELEVDGGIEKLASLAEQVVHEAEAMAGEAAHNFQIAMKAATSGATGVVPTLGGVNSYLRQSVEINTKFLGEFAKVRSPVDLVSLQMRFLEEHRAAMLEFSRQWAKKNDA